MLLVQVGPLLRREIHLKVRIVKETEVLIVVEETRRTGEEIGAVIVAETVVPIAEEETELLIVGLEGIEVLTVVAEEIAIVAQTDVVIAVLIDVGTEAEIVVPIVADVNANAVQEEIEIVVKRRSAENGLLRL